MNICSFNYWFCHLVYSLLKHFARPTISLIEIYHILLLKKLRKLHKWRTKEAMGLKKKQCIWKSCPRNRNKNPAKTWCRTSAIHLALQLLQLLFTEVSSEVEAWLRCARLHKKWIENQWQGVLRSDECQCESFGSNDHRYVRRRSGETLSVYSYL